MFKLFSAYLAFVVLVNEEALKAGRAIVLVLALFAVFNEVAAYLALSFFREVVLNAGVASVFAAALLTVIQEVKTIKAFVSFNIVLINALRAGIKG